jgi:hypothetical protein
MATPFTITHTVGRVPTFAELQALAKEHEIQINGTPQAGEFSHSKATGKYAFEKNGDLGGDFTGQHVLGIITGVYVIATGKAEVTINSKPFLMPEGALKANILEGLKVFCAKFPPA